MSGRGERGGRGERERERNANWFCLKAKLSSKRSGALPSEVKPDDGGVIDAGSLSLFCPIYVSRISRRPLEKEQVSPTSIGRSRQDSIFVFVFVLLLLLPLLLLLLFFRAKGSYPIPKL